eukprot:6211165-Pleurochrysis_carterae.AAC.1
MKPAVGGRGDGVSNQRAIEGCDSLASLRYYFSPTHGHYASAKDLHIHSGHSRKYVAALHSGAIVR